MKSKTISLIFLTEVGKKVTVKIPHIKEEISDEEISALMDKFISTGVLMFDGSKLKDKVGAKLIEQLIEVFEYKA